jgi:hypothetical protein
MEPAVRHTPEDIAGVRKCLHGYPPYMKVEVRGDIPVVAKTVADLCSLSTWPPGLILNFPQPGDRYPESVVVVERAS